MKFPKISHIFNKIFECMSEKRGKEVKQFRTFSNFLSQNDAPNPHLVCCLILSCILASCYQMLYSFVLF